MLTPTLTSAGTQPSLHSLTVSQACAPPLCGWTLPSPSHCWRDHCCWPHLSPSLAQDRAGTSPTTHPPEISAGEGWWVTLLAGTSRESLDSWCTHVFLLGILPHCYDRWLPVGEVAKSTALGFGRAFRRTGTHVPLLAHHRTLQARQWGRERVMGAHGLQHAVRDKWSLETLSPLTLACLLPSKTVELELLVTRPIVR